MKKAISALLIVVLIVMTFPLSALAATQTYWNLGSGNDYVVEDKQFDNSVTTSKYFRLNTSRYIYNYVLAQVGSGKTGNIIITLRDKSCGTQAGTYNCNLDESNSIIHNSWYRTMGHAVDDYYFVLSNGASARIYYDLTVSHSYV